MPAFWIGVDGGGSRTRAVVAEEDLVAKGRGASGSANASTRPLPVVVETILEAVDDAAASAGVAAEKAEGIGVGLAGVESAGLEKPLVAALEERFGIGRVLVTTDARIALAGRHLRVDWPVLARMMRLARTAMLQYLIGTASWLTLARINAAFGSNAVAGYSLALRIILFALMPSWGICSAAATLVIGLYPNPFIQFVNWSLGIANITPIASVLSMAISEGTARKMNSTSAVTMCSRCSS